MVDLSIIMKSAGKILLADFPVWHSLGWQWQFTATTIIW